jgi:CRISPR/Cas system-associated exonuclease Cas4 (RecB family)
VSLLSTPHDVPVDPQRITRIRQLVARVWRAIQGGNFYPAPTVMNCTTCPFQQACAGWTGD